MTQNLLHIPVSCWLYLCSRTFWNVIGSFIQMLRIHAFVMFCAVKARFQRLLFVEWNIYDMLRCSYYCVTIPIGLTIGRKLKVTLNVSSLMKGWSERSTFNVGMVEIFVLVISSNPGDHHLPNLLLCSSKFSDKQYLGFLLYGSHHFILSLLLCSADFFDKNGNILELAPHTYFNLFYLFMNIFYLV